MPGPKERDYIGEDAFMRGDTWPLSDDAVEFDADETSRLTTPGVVLRATIKRYLEQDDPADVDPLVDAATGVLQVDSHDRTGITVLGAASFRAVFPAAQTELLEPGLYFYDVVIDFSTVKSEVLWYGQIEVTEDITDARGA